MLTLKKIAVTGGLSCGKSEACHFFKEFGAYVVSADEIVHQLLTPTTDLGKNIIDLLGADVVVNQTIDRSQVAKKVFNQPELLYRLEQILHPVVMAEVEKRFQQVKELNLSKLFVVEIPLLYECGYDNLFDYIVVVKAPREICKQRFGSSTGLSREEYDRRMRRQMSVEEKAEKADFIIFNDGTLSNMRQAVQTITRKVVSSERVH